MHSRSLGLSTIRICQILSLGNIYANQTQNVIQIVGVDYNSPLRSMVNVAPFYSSFGIYQKTVKLPQNLFLGVGANDNVSLQNRRKILSLAGPKCQNPILNTIK